MDIEIKIIKSIKYLPQTYWAGYYEDEEERNQLLTNFEKRFKFKPTILYYIKDKEKMLYVDLVDKLLPNELDLIELEQTASIGHMG